MIIIIITDKYWIKSIKNKRYIMYRTRNFHQKPNLKVWIKNLIKKVKIKSWIKIFKLIV